MTDNTKVKAIIWDFDGTLASTFEKNLNVTRKIFQKITGRKPEEISALRSLANYKSAIIKSTNWRDFCTQESGLSEEETDEAGRLWTEYQLEDDTPMPIFSGISEVIRALNRFPQGIVSMNSKENIEKCLTLNNLREFFKCIVGYEEVDFHRQKPEPDGLLLCLKNLTEFAPGNIFYIGDHETDARCSLNANEALQKEGLSIKIISVAAFYGNSHDDSDWKFKADFRAKHPNDILDLQI